MTDKQMGSINSRIDDLFAPWKGTDTPGAQVAVAMDGKLIHSKGYGSAQLEYGVEISPHTVFHLASVSKQFTAAAANLLALEGRLSLDDDIRDHVPEVHDFGERITIRHLIHHTSGLRDQWELLVAAGWRMDDVITHDHIMKIVSRQHHLNFVPGEEHLYSNTGYTLLAEIVSRVSGIGFGEFCDQKIFRPLGMTQTHVHDDHTRVVPGRAYSYNPHRDHRFKNAVLSYANAGATSLFSTGEDLIRWLRNFTDPAVGGPGLLDLMHSKAVLNDGSEIPYASGLSFTKHRGLEIVGHSGGDAGFRTWCGRVVDHRLDIVVLSNLGTFNPYGMALEIAEIILEAHMDPVSDEPVPGDNPSRSELEGCTGMYLRMPFGMAEVELRGDQLELTLGDGEAVSLTPQGGLAFVTDPGGIELTFLTGDEGIADRVEIRLGTSTMTACRFHPVELGPDALDQCAGAYWSHELRTHYTIRSNGRNLVLGHDRHEDVELLAAGDDLFTGRGRRPGELSLIRCGGEVRGFTMTGGRVRNIKFEKA